MLARRMLLLMQKRAMVNVVKFNATTTRINAGTHASIDDLHAAEFTVEAFVKALGWGENNQGALFEKKGGNGGNVGWSLKIQTLYGFRSEVQCLTTAAAGEAAIITPDSLWHHVVMYFNNAGDRKIYLGVDGVWAASYSKQTAGVDAIKSDAAQTLYIGNDAGSVVTWDGYLGWIRISNNDRYNHGANFAKPSRKTYPNNDANTVRLFKMNEGTGTTIIDYSTNAQNASLANGTWAKE